MTSPTLYAKNTTVQVDRSRAEVHKLLRRYGATRIADAWEKGGRAAIQFEIGGYVTKLTIPMPTEAEIKNRKFARKSPKAIKSALAQAEKQRWRTMLLLLKAKLESCALGLTTFEHEFLASLVTKSGATVGERFARLGGESLALPAKGET